MRHNNRLQSDEATPRASGETLYVTTEIDESDDTQGRWIPVLFLLPGRNSAACAYL